MTLYSFGENHLRIVWRGSLGLGVIQYAKIPYMLILRRYGVSLAAISITWFIYDFITYVFSFRCEILYRVFISIIDTQSVNYVVSSSFLF